MSIYNSIADKLVEANIGNKVCEISSYKQVGNTVKVVASFIGIKNPEQARTAILSATNHNLTAIEGSFIVEPKTDGSFTAHGFLKKATVTKPITASTKMKALAKNVLMDDTDDSIWDIAQDEVSGLKHLVKRVPEEDITKLVAIASNNESIVDKYSIKATALENNNTIVNYVNPDKAETSFGVVISSNDNTVQVFDYNYRKYIDIPVEALLLVSDLSQDEGWDGIKEGTAQVVSKEVMSSLMQNEVSYSDVRDYYGAMFNYAPEYFEEFMTIIQDYGF